LQAALETKKRDVNLVPRLARAGFRSQATREFSRTREPRAITFVEAGLQLLLILNPQKHDNSCMPGLLDNSPH